MKIAVQWTTQDPSDWEFMDSSAWAGLSAKPDPTGTNPPLDNDRGWVHAICVQGVCFRGYDHYSVEHLGQDCRVVCWSDTDPDIPRYGIEYYFEPLQPNEYGAWDTKQTVAQYHEGWQYDKVERLPPIKASGGWLEKRHYRDFQPPQVHTLHGKMVEWEHCLALDACRKNLMYDRDWLEQLPGDEIEEVNGVRKLRDQAKLGRRIPKQGTRTWYFTDTAAATTINSATGSGREQEMSETGDGGTDTTQVSQNYGGGDDHVEWVFTTPSGEPGEGTWPTGSYVGQFRVTATDANMSYGFTTADTERGELARVDTGLNTEVDNVQQSQALFTGTGTKTGSNTWSPGGTVTADRFQAVLAGTRAATHGNQSFTIALNDTTSFAEGPFPSGTTHNITENDNLGIDETVTRRVLYDRDFTDNLAVQENVSTSVSFGVLESDNLAIQDSASTSISFGVLESDNLAWDESVTAALSIGVLESDNLAIQEGVTREVTYNRSLTDNLAVQEDVTREVDYDRSFTDNLAIQDNAATSISFGVLESDNLAWQENITTGVLYERSFTDNLAVQEGSIVVALSIGVLESDNLAVQDDVSREVTYNRSLTDNLAIQDSDTVARSIGVLEDDNLAIQDSLTREVIYSRSFSDNLAWQENVAAEIPAAGAQTIEVTDNLAIQDPNYDTNVRYIGEDNLAVQESITRRVLYDRSTSDNLAISDNAITSMAFGVIETDNLAISENVIRRVLYDRSLTDNLAIQDIDTVARSIGVLEDDNLAIQEAVTRAVIYRRLLSDNLAWQEFVDPQIAGSGFKTIAEVDNLAFQDDVTRRVFYDRAFSDNLALQEFLTRSVTYERSFTENLALQESVAVFSSFGILATDNLAIQDDVTRSVVYARSFTDNLAISENVLRRVDYNRSVSDFLAIQENVVRGVLYDRSFSDNLAISEFIDTFKSVGATQIIVGIFAYRSQIEDLIVEQLDDGTLVFQKGSFNVPQDLSVSAGDAIAMSTFDRPQGEAIVIQNGDGTLDFREY